MRSNNLTWKGLRSRVLRYGLAVFVVFAALKLVRTVPELSVGLGPGSVGILIILVSAGYGGRGPGLLTTAMACLVALSYMTIRVRSGLYIPVPRLISVMMFAVGGIATTLLIDALHVARRRAEESTEEARRHRETLRRSEERLSAILEHSPAVVYMKDTQGRYLMVNRRFTTIFHLDEANILGKTDFDLFPAEDAERFARNDRMVAEARKAIEFEELVPQDDGVRIYLSIKFPLFEDDGEVSAICGKSTDITDRKRAEERRALLGRQAALRADVSMALATNEPDLSPILRSCAEAVVRHLDVASARIWTLDGPGDALVLQAFAGLVSPGDDRLRRVPLGDSWIGAVARDRRPLASQEPGGSVLGELTEPRVREGIVAFVGFPLLVEDRVLGVLGLFARRPFDEDTREALAALADVIAQGIERKRLEIERIDLLARERLSRAEAESANHAKDQFLAVLSHELRTPLTPILASVSAMLDEPGTHPEFRPVLELTRWGIELEARLIDDLLDMTQIIRGQLRLRRETSDVHALIGRALELCRQEIEARGITLVRELSAVEHHVDADPLRLEQVFWNLIKNAVKFSPEGGTLTIRTRNELGAGAEVEYQHVPELVTEVSDTGIGIEPDLLPKIFDAFIQGEAGWVRRFGGLGLGLSICRSVVESHGGRIVAESAGTGRGATFTIALATVPAVDAAPAPVGAVTSPGPVTTSSRPSPPSVAVVDPAPGLVGATRPLKILLVEDDGPTLKVMTRLLCKAPYLVETANTLAGALEVATAGDFDLIISDIGLPDGTGLELMRQIRERYAARGIALSGYGLEEDIRRSREAGFNAHLTKPVDFQKLQVVIQQVTATPIGS